MRYLITYLVLNPNTGEWRETRTNAVTLAKVTEYLAVIESDDALDLVKVEPQ